MKTPVPLISIMFFLIVSVLHSMAQDNFKHERITTVRWKDDIREIFKKQPVRAQRDKDSLASNIGCFRYFLNEKQGLMNFNGNIITDPIYDFIYAEQENGTAGYQIGDKQGILNWHTGKQVTPPIYDAVTQYSEGLAAVTLDGIKWGYIDTVGSQVISPQWNFASAFQDGIAKVIKGDDVNRIGYLGPMDVYPTPGETGYIDKTGKYVIPMEYSYISTHTDSDDGYLRFTKGTYSCEEPNGHCENPYRGSKWGIMDIKGTILLPDNEYDFLFPLYLDDELLFGVEKQGKYGVLDPKTMQLIVPLHNSPNIKELTHKIRVLRAIHN